MNPIPPAGLLALAPTPASTHSGLRATGSATSHRTDVIHFACPDSAAPSSPTNTAVQSKRRSRSFRKGAEE